MHLQTTQSLIQRQSLVMTAQLQQAIFLLQLSNLDLQSYLEAEAETNPFLKVAPAAPEAGPATLSERANALAGADYDDAAARLADHPRSLYAHVSAQFDLMFPDPAERLLAEGFLESLEPSGWLGEPVETIAQRLGLRTITAEIFLARVQQVEPAGLFARDLAECLTLQLRDQELMTPAYARLLANLRLVAAADLPALCRICRTDAATLRAMLARLRSLNPKPGADFDGADAPQRSPDLIVTEGPDGWRVDLNRSTLPSVRIDAEAARAAEADETARAYAAERVGVAQWLRRAVQHRNRTTLDVGAEIARRQRAFLDHGPSHLAPMTLREVAEAISVHESTVSRVTTGIMMTTPHGTFGLKHFFTTALRTDGDEDGTSASVIRHRIAALVREEDPSVPLSDDAIAQMVSDGGVHIARRTVAKYRRMLKIPSSFQRRRQAQLRAG